MRLTYNGRSKNFPSGSSVTIGRSSDCDVVVDNPMVSRSHARLTWDGNAAVLEAVGRGATLCNGQQITSVRITGRAEVRLANAQGPVLYVEPVAAPAPAPAAPQPAPQGPPPGYGQAQGAPVYGAPAHPQPAPPAGAPGGYGHPGQAPGMPGPGGPYAPGPYGAPPNNGPAPNYGPGGGLGGPYGMPNNGRPAQGHDLSSALQIVLPVKTWLHSPEWKRQGLRLLVIPYALVPLIFLQVFSHSQNPTNLGWALSLYFAPLWLVAFWSLIRPDKVTREQIGGAVLVIIAVYIWIKAITIPINDHLNPSHFFDALGVGYNEECTKALPVLILAIIVLNVRHEKWDARTWMLIGTVAGLTFGVAESAKDYTPTFLVAIAQGQAPIIQGFLSIFERITVDGFQHAVWAGISGFFIGIGMSYRRQRIPLIVFGISLAAFLHAFNDWMLSHISSLWPWIGWQTLSLLLFLGYAITARDIIRNVRKSGIFRGDSILADPVSGSLINDH